METQYGINSRFIWPSDPEALEYPGGLQYLHIKLFRPRACGEDPIGYPIYAKFIPLGQKFIFEVEDSQPGMLRGDRGILQFRVVKGRPATLGGVGYRIPKRGVEPIPLVELHVEKNSKLDPVLHLIFLQLGNFKDFTFQLKLGIEPDPYFVEHQGLDRPNLMVVSGGGKIRKLELVVPKRLQRAASISKDPESVLESLWRKIRTEGYLTDQANEFWQKVMSVWQRLSPS